MAVETTCQTPGCEFHTRICPEFVRVEVIFPEPLNLTEQQAKLLETNLHNAVELVLARYFKEVVS